MSRKVYVYDLETLPDLFTATFLDRDTDETVVFHSNQDDYIKNMLSFLNTRVQGLIGYNCIAFDGQIIQDIYLGNAKLQERYGIELISILRMREITIILYLLNI